MTPLTPEERLAWDRVVALLQEEGVPSVRNVRVRVRMRRWAWGLIEALGQASHASEILCRIGI